MMDDRLQKIDYLKSLINNFQNKSPGNLPNSGTTNNYNINNDATERKMNINTFPESRYTDTLTYQNSNNSIQSKPSTMAYNVYVNPYFKPQNPVVHINPKMHLKPLIHINPKMVQNVTSTNDTTINNTSNIMSNSQENLTQMDIKKLKLHAKPSIHVNPKIMSSIANSNATTENNYKCVTSNNNNNNNNNKKSFIRTDVKKSVYVNPKLMSKLSSTKESKTVEKKETIPNFNHPSCSRLKFVRKIDNTKTPIKKTNMSNILVLSKRKLVRAKRTMKENTVISPLGPNKVKRLSQTKKIKTTALQSTNNITNNNKLQSTSNNVNLSKIHNAKRKINQYKIDRTVKSLTEPKENEVPPAKKSKYDLMELVTIGGIVYKSSRNQLVRRSYSSKRKHTANTKRDKFIIATNGKKLCRLKLSKDIPNRKNVLQTTESKFGSMANSKTTYKKNISNKVKQRSIQILRNKMRKNNQPCLFFQRFGYCANQKKGTCSKLHDKKQISVCKKFLQGKCLLDVCPLSHDVGPEKMPTCKYFLEACCMRDHCPYRHVKVSSSTPICREFLQGYCSKGNECKLRHEHLCPEYNKTGNCNKGKHCPYPHKPTTSTARQTKKYIKKKPNATKSQNAPTMENDTELINHECKLRYYESTDTINTNLTTKRDNIIKQMQIMKNVVLAQQSDELFTNEELSNNNVTEPSISEKESTNCLENTLPKRLPLGILPAFIPIN
ncbi:zinc finger CCCH domain-containing protein 3 [Polistes fuscatus]|uniref:zinc finger CCCH domain-containing protein 3 n=1 Tax=Polistes fuscatus TaxID=30207 RepID=UPI001CA878FB|nr:zinc finger CCCH domain-containing protein 3 [Polistes fuscatus]